VTAAISAWCDAQQRCCEGLLAHAHAGLWPMSLWQAQHVEARAVDSPCVCCGVSPITERVYDSPPGPARVWSECNRCDITLDRPLIAGHPSLELAAPAEIRHGQQCSLKITITCEPSSLWCGAGVVAIGAASHGVAANPATFQIRCDGTSVFEQQITLSLPEPPPIAHLYRLRVLTLLNNHWLWASRFLQVRS